MRVLLIVPESGASGPRLNTVPEVRRISAMHRVTILHGPVRVSEIYEYAQAGNYDVLHYGLHGDSKGISVGNELMDRDDLYQVAKLAGVHLVFFNACYSGALGSFLVARGIPFAISTNEEVADMDAWKMPLSFYEYLARDERRHRMPDVPSAYQDAEGGEGDYNLHVNWQVITPPARVTRLEWAVATLALMVLGLAVAVGFLIV